MAKKKKKKQRTGGPRPQAAKRPAPKQGSAQGNRAAAAENTKAQPTRAQPTRAQPTRAQRLEAGRRARRRKSIMSRLAVGGIAALLVAFVVIRVVGGRGEADETTRQLTAGSCTFDRKADRTDPAPRNHVANPTYKVDPPGGGNHSQQVARRAVYTEGQVPPDGQIVHAMEHGYVVLWHRPDLSDKDRQALLDAASRHEVDVLVVPRPSLSTPVAATAWGRRLLCGNVEPDALDLFTRTYRNQGPEKVPHQ